MSLASPSRYWARLRQNFKAVGSDFDKAIRINPNFAHAYLNQAIMRKELGDRRSATEDAQKAASLAGTQGDSEIQQRATRLLRKLQASNQN